MDGAALNTLACNRPTHPGIGGHQLIEIHVYFFIGSVVVKEGSPRQALGRTGLLNSLPDIVRGHFKRKTHLRGQIQFRLGQHPVLRT